jgi:hypothetical protein
MKKPNWTRFIRGLYCWTVEDNYRSKVVVYRDGRKHARNNFCQILDRIFEDYSFWDFKEARKLVKKYKDSYKIYYEKLM